MITIQLDVFVHSFSYSSVPDNKYHKQKWHILFFYKLVVHALACAWDKTKEEQKFSIAKQKWQVLHPQNSWSDPRETLGST